MIIGRTNEIKIFKEAYEDKYSSFIAVYGRRRIGKTFLVKEVFENKFDFYFTGSYGASKEQQLFNFKNELKKYGLNHNKKIKSWAEAFFLLEELLDKSVSERKVIFLDELSWIDTINSNFISSLEYFWNSYASSRKDIILVVASSSTSWMMKKIIHNKGGLYNRLTHKLHLKPFSLMECEEFMIKEKQTQMTRNEITKLYMVFGGVPYYWNKYKRGFSVDQNINNLFFSENAELKTEYYDLFKSIYNNYEEYMSLISLLYSSGVGLTRNEICERLNVESGGSLTEKLNNLEECDFIRSYHNFKNKNNKVYQVIDEFVLFYNHHIKNNENNYDYWINNINSSVQNTWMGIAFEKVCMKHIDQIKNALGIPAVSTDIYSYKSKPNNLLGLSGCQIDLILDRADNIINIFEIKFTNSNYYIDKEEYNKIINRREVFIRNEKIKKSVWIILLTNNGLAKNMYSDICQKEIVLDELFCR